MASGESGLVKTSRTRTMNPGSVTETGAAPATRATSPQVVHHSLRGGSRGTSRSKGLSGTAPPPADRQAGRQGKRRGGKGHSTVR